jgi:protein TonB
MSRPDEVHLSQDGEVQAPLAAPTYLTHVTVPVFRLARAFGIAAFLHVFIALLFIAILQHHFRALQPQEATVALIMEPSPFVGTGATVITPVARPAPYATSAPAAQERPVKAVATRTQNTQTSPDQAAAAAHAELPLPAPPAPPAPHPTPIVKPQPAPPPPPHLGNNQPAGHGLVTSAHVVPARPNARLNLPPAYPPEAKALDEQGRVLLAVEVAPSGVPSAVTIVNSSGFVILDAAARDALLGWRFLPAYFHGQPVASTLLWSVTFELDAVTARAR